MDDLLADFIAEAREMMEAISGEIVAWEADPSDRERLDAIFRFVHTVKGNCGFFDFPELERLAHATENALSDCRADRRDADEELVTAVLQVIDRIAEMVDAIGKGEDFPDGDDDALIAALSEDSEKQDVSPAAATGASASVKARSQAAAPRTIRLPVDLLDRVMSGVSDMAVARNDLSRRLAQVETETGLEVPFNRLSAILTDLGEAITRIRMQPIEAMFAGFPRMVRDLSHELGKQVLVELDPGDVEIDREMVELVRDPMVHIIRNAIDHGIESPAERLAEGKRETGTLSISARQTGSEIRIGIVDDGRGINGDELIARAIAAKVVTAQEARNLTPRERNMLICAPGLSTKEEVTAVSGRGVGMDVVLSNIEKIGGSLTIDSTPGSGTRILLNIPLTLSIVPSLTVAVGEHSFALPRSYVEEIVRLSVEDIDSKIVGGREFILIRGQRLPCVGLDRVLGITSRCSENDRLYILIKLVGGDVFGLAVDAILSHEELVVKPLAPVLMASGLYVGSTQLDDGKPIPMLDVAGVARTSGMISEVKDRIARNTGSQPVAETIETGVRSALHFVGFDDKERAIDMSEVQRIETVAAAAIRRSGTGPSTIVLDGRIVPLHGLQKAGEASSADSMTLFRLGEGDGQIAYAYRDMVDLVTYDPSTVTTSKPMSGQRLALINGRPVELLDSMAMLAQRSNALTAEI